MSDFRDPKSVAGKQLPLAETTQLLVIGAGPAGIAAAAEAAKHGIKVVLADENPVPVAAMGDDIPLHFGQRYGAAARNRTSMLEALIARDPAIAELFDAGVDVRLGTSVWGLYANGPSVGWLPGPVAGLHDGERSFMLGCERVIVAAGRRDMGLAFPGWELPGVLGITAAERLLLRFDVLDARRVVVLGTSTEALVAARSLRAGGIKVAALVEVAREPVGPTELLRELADIPILCGHRVRRAEGGANGVEAIVVAPEHGQEQRIACDAILLAVGVVPVIELLDALGCQISYLPERGGHVPLLDGAQRTSVAGIYGFRAIWDG
jgi:thioredoxin reductase